MRDDDERGVNKYHHTSFDHHCNIRTCADGCKKYVHHQHAGLEGTMEIFELLVKHIGHQQGDRSDEQDAVIGDIQSCGDTITNGADGQADRQGKADMCRVEG